VCHVSAVSRGRSPGNKTRNLLRIGCNSVRSALLRCYAERRLSSEHAGWGKGSCVTSRRFHAAVLRVIVPPSAPERTLQASGEGQAIARPKGGPPCCSVPVASTRWAASGASPPLNQAVCACTKASSHTHTCVRVQPDEIPGRRNPEENRLPVRANHKAFANGSKIHRTCLAHASKF
jgi:hypothetical protein